MEPVSLLLATGAVAVYAAHVADKLKDGGKEPTTLPDVMARLAHDDDLPVPVVAVRARSARLAPELAGAKLRVRVKHGDPGASSRCDTCYAVASACERPATHAFTRMRAPCAELPTAAVDFGGTTCLFLGRPGEETVLRLRLRRSGRLRALAKAELRLPAHWTGVEERELSLVGARASNDDALGTLRVSVELRHVPKGRLRQYLQLLDAEEQKGAFATGATAVVQGTCCTGEADSEAEGSPDEDPGAVPIGRPVALAVASDNGAARARILRTVEGIQRTLSGPRLAGPRPGRAPVAARPAGPREWRSPLADFLSAPGDGVPRH